MGEIMKLLFGADFKLGTDGIMGMLGNEGMSNLLEGITKYKSGQDMSDMLDLQKGFATNAEARTQTLFEDDQERNDRNKSLKFS